MGLPIDFAMLTFLISIGLIALLAVAVAPVRGAVAGVVLAANSIASAWIFVLMILVTADIVARFALNAPISGVTEIVEISILSVLYLQVTHALKTGRITRSDALYTMLRRKAPWLGESLGFLFHIAGAALAVVLIIGGWPQWIRAFEGNYFVGNVGVFTFPQWPQKFLLVAGSALIAIQFVLLAADNIRALAGKAPLETTDAESVEVIAFAEDRSRDE